MANESSILDHRLMAAKLSAIDERHDLERVLSFYDEFRAYVEQLAKALAAGDDLSSIVAPRLSLINQIADHEHRFVVSGELVTGPLDLINHPNHYVGNPSVFSMHVQHAIARFEYLIKKQLRALYELDDEIRVLANETTAREHTLVVPDERSKIMNTVRRADELAEMVVKWGNRAIKLGGIGAILRLYGGA